MADSVSPTWAFKYMNLCYAPKMRYKGCCCRVRQNAPAKKVLLRPGIEPGSSACEALVLTDIRTKLLDGFEKDTNEYKHTHTTHSSRSPTYRPQTTDLTK